MRRSRTGSGTACTRGFLSDEGLRNAIRVIARAMTNGTVRRRMTWMMTRISRAVPYLGYVVIAGRRPSEDSAG